MESWPGELAQELGEGLYAPQAVRQVLIPNKQKGKWRASGNPCIRDRVVQTFQDGKLQPDVSEFMGRGEHLRRPDIGNIDEYQRRVFIAKGEPAKLLDTQLSVHVVYHCPVDRHSYADSFNHLAPLR